MVLFDCVRISWKFVLGACARIAIVVIADKVELKDASATMDCIATAGATGLTNLQ